METEATRDQWEAHLYRITQEIKRISTTTLRGNFVKEEDREYWVQKLKKTERGSYRD